MLPLLPVCPSDFLALAFPSFDKWTPQSDTDVSVQWDRQFIMHTRCAHTFKFCWPLTISDHWLRFCLTERCDWKIPSGASRSDWGTARAMGVMEGDRDEKTGSKREGKKKKHCGKFQSSQLLNYFIHCGCITSASPLTSMTHFIFSAKSQCHALAP